MKLKKNILLDIDLILKKSEVMTKLDESEMDHLKGGDCWVWLFDKKPPTPSPPPSPPCTGCATSCQNSSSWSY